MLTDEAQVHSEIAMLKFDLEEMAEARQRTRARCKRAGKLAQEHWLTLKILGGMHKEVVKNWMESLDELCITTIERNQWEFRAQLNRKRLRRVLGMAKEFRYQVLAWKDRYQDNQDNLFRANLKMGRARRWSAAWKAAAKKHRTDHRGWRAAGEYVFSLLLENYRLQDRLEAERNELQRQLKGLSDCIMHYAPTDFPILKYDSAAEALVALLEKGDANEPDTDKS